MNDYDFKTLLDNLNTARIYAGAELGRLCNKNQHIDACVFQSIRDSLTQNIQLLQSYVICKEAERYVLEKITSEIQDLRGCSCSNSDGIIDDVEDVIDKYKAERSEE